MARGRARADGTVVPKGPNYGGALGAIKKHCRDCMGDQPVKYCSVDGCWLFPFRFGKGPDISRFEGKKVDPTEYIGRAKRDDEAQHD